MELVLIAAVAENGVIGREDTLPWHLPEDLAHFKQTTMGGPVIMGRVAFEDILDTLGEPLPGRTNIVLSRSDPTYPAEVIVAETFPEALEAAQASGTDTAYVAGGATVYEVAFSEADRLLLTELHEAYEGDVTFPDWDRSAWRVASREVHDRFDIVEYVRAGDER